METEPKTKEVRVYIEPARAAKRPGGEIKAGAICVSHNGGPPMMATADADEAVKFARNFAAINRARLNIEPSQYDDLKLERLVFAHSSAVRIDNLSENAAIMSKRPEDRTPEDTALLQGDYGAHDADPTAWSKGDDGFGGLGQVEDNSSDGQEKPAAPRAAARPIVNGYNDFVADAKVQREVGTVGSDLKPLGITDDRSDDEKAQADKELAAANEWPPNDPPGADATALLNADLTRENAAIKEAERAKPEPAFGSGRGKKRRN